MKREDEYYEKWLDKLKTTQPVLNQPDELTAEIMQRISRSTSKKNWMLSISGWMLMTVAGLLLCLLVGETFFSPISAPKDREEQVIWKAVSLSLPDNWEAMNRFEKSCYVSSVFRQKELQRMEKECFVEYIVKNQIKSVDYEKE